MSETAPAVSILVAYYDNSRHIGGIVDALKRQSFTDFETVVVIDRRSEDDLPLVREGFSALGNVRCVVQEGSGLGDARNQGIREASGEYVWFLDMDDVPADCFLEDLVRIIREEDADTVFCNHFQETGDVIPGIPDLQYSVKSFTGEEAVGIIDSFPVYSWSRIQKRSLFSAGDCCFRNLKAMEDYDQTIRQVACSEKVCYYDKPLYVYRKTPDSATLKNRVHEIDTMEDIASTAFPFVKERCPASYEAFRTCMINRLMRQMAFAPYKEFRKGYKATRAHALIDECENPTREMKIYQLSGTLYFLALYRYAHGKWDKKEGVWGPLPAR